MIHINAIVCAWGNTQVSVVDFFDNYVTVVKFPTIWMMLILSQVLYINMKHANHTIIFDQYFLNYDEEVFIKLPHLFDMKQ